MMRLLDSRVRYWIGLACAIGLVGPGASRPAAAQDKPVTQIQQRIVALTLRGGGRIAGTPIEAVSFIQRLYERRGYRRAWVDPATTHQLRQAILDSRLDGLRAGDFHSHVLGFSRLDYWPAAITDAERDIMKTSALINLLYQLYFGKVSPERLDPRWNLKRQELPLADAAQAISTAIDEGKVTALVARARGDSPWYAKLRQALQKYKRLAAAGGWPTVPAGPALKPGMTDPRAAALRRRLAVTGEYTGPPEADASTYDAALVAAVERFQRNHGIDVDGIVGPAALKALNVTAQQRVDQVRVNLERARWMSRPLRSKKDLVIVNIAGFYLLTILDGKLAWSTAVITGKPYHKTPVFTDQIRYIEFNPTWTIPPGILRNEILPQQRRNPAYISAKGYDLITREGRKINPATVDWSTMQGRGFPYRVVQPPGPKNALGRVKFMFPNRYNVYLHDTPGRGLFSKTGRAFSHGCVRVQDPLKFAEILLRHRNGTARGAIDRWLASGRQTRVNLKAPLPVAIMYWTVDPLFESGIRFYDDVYGRDAKVLKALDARFRPASSR